jgi:VanZ family protein
MSSEQLIPYLYSKWARKLAIAWTLLIFFLCFLPAEDIPAVNIPFIDKWTHFILFGMFSFLWLTAWPSLKASRLLLIFVLSVLDGWLVEFIQGQLPSLHRYQENLDILADGLGGLLGVIVFYFTLKWYLKT